MGSSVLLVASSFLFRQKIGAEALQEKARAVFDLSHGCFVCWLQDISQSTSSANLDFEPQKRQAAEADLR